MRKRLAVISAVAVAALALYMLRVPVVGLLARDALGERGIAVQSLEVQRVSLDELALANIVLGRNREFKARAVVVSWHFAGLFGVALTQVLVDGARLDVNLADGAPPLGSLQGLIAGDRASETSPDMPKIELRDAIAKLRSGAGDYSVGLNGTVDAERGGAPHAIMNIIVDGQMGRLIGVFNATAESSGRLVGTVAITDGAIEVADAKLAGVRGNGAITLSGGELVQAKGRLTVRQLTVPLEGPLKDALRLAVLELELDPANVRLQANLRGVDDSTALHLDVRAADYRAEPTLDVEAKLSANADAKLWPMLGVDSPTQGAVSLSLTGRGRTPRFDGLRDNWLEWVSGVTFQTDGALVAEQLSYAAKLDALNGTVAFKGGFADGAGLIVISDGGRITVKNFHPKWLASQGLPAWLADVASDGVRLDLVSNGDETTKITLSIDEAGLHVSAQFNATAGAKRADVRLQASGIATVDKGGEVASFELHPSSAAIETRAMSVPGMGKVEHARMTLAGRLAGTPRKWSGEVEATANAQRVQIASVRAEKTAIRLPFRIAGGVDHWSLNLARPGSFSPGSLAPIGATRVKTSRNWVVSELSVNAVDIGQGLTSLEHSATLKPGAITVAVKRPGQPATSLDFKPRHITMEGKLDAVGNYRASCVVDARSLNAPTLQLAAKDIAATFQCGAQRQGPLLRFAVKSLAHTAQPAVFAPVRLDGRINEDSKGYALQATGRISNVPRMRLGGRYAPVKGLGEVTFNLLPVTLSPGQLQPADLFPVLATLMRVSGQVGFRGRLRWSADKVDSSATLELDNLSFDQDSIAISGLSSTLKFDDLLATRSRPRQMLSIKRIELGVPLENLTMSYQFEASEPPRVDIGNASVETLGGTLSVGAASFRADKTADVVLTIKTLDLARLFEALAIVGLTGTGSISGQIPLAFNAGKVSIRDGRLAAGGRGVLRFTSERAAEFLAGGGDQAQLLLRALENFHYSELTLALAKSGEDDLTATLSTLGNNPDVLRGQLFRLNINLESNIRKILDALGRGFQWSNEALRGGFSVR